MRYADGQDVMLGDKVRLGDDDGGVVVCSIDTGEYGAEAQLFSLRSAVTPIGRRLGAVFMGWRIGESVNVWAWPTEAPEPDLILSARARPSPHQCPLAVCAPPTGSTSDNRRTARIRPRVFS